MLVSQGIHALGVSLSMSSGDRVARVAPEVRQ